MSRIPFALTRRTSVVAAALLALAAVAASIDGSSWVWAVGVSALALVAIVGIDAWRGVSPRQLEVHRLTPGSLVRGSVDQLSWRLVNPTTQRVHVAVADEFAPSLGAARRAEAWLEPRGEVTIAHRLAPTRRGRFALGPLVVRCAGPWGVVARQTTVTQLDELRVLPPLNSRRKAALISRTRRNETGLRSTRGRGPGTDFDQLREYTAGDDPRHIDWSATARSDRPIVRTFTVEQHRPVVLLMDAGHQMAALVDRAPLIEHAMDAAAALSVAASRVRDRTSLIAYDTELRAELAPGDGAAHPGRLIETVFDLEASGRPADHEAAAISATLRTRERAIVVMLTELSQASVVEALLPATATLARHDVIVASTRDPRLDEWLGASPGHRADLHRAAAAANELARRERSAALLRDAGVTVVDEPPGEAAVALVKAYLELAAA